MPRRQPKAEVPRWRRGQRKQQATPHIRLSPKQEAQLVRQITGSAALQGQVIGHAAPQGKTAGAIARTGAYRFRYQLVPFAWLDGVVAIGAGARAPHTTHAAVIGILLGVAAAAAMILLTRHLPACPEKGKGHSRCFTRHAWQAMAALTALWVTALSLGAGSWHPLLFAGLVCWVGVLVPWVRHYRIRAETPGKAPAPAAPVNDYVIFTKLAGEKKWNASLGPVEHLPGGGRRYLIRTDGIKTTIGNILSMPENVAGAWHAPMTEAYAERSDDGITSSGYLTVLGSETLQRVQEWDGSGIDPQTGVARVGRFADGSAAHVKFFTPRYGTRHALISGTTGSGKSEALNLFIFIAIQCGWIVPVVLDPQEGQSLPYWRDRCLYAAGKADCLRMLRGLHSGMLDRSRYLAGLRWDDDGVPMRGMGFFDHWLTSLPGVLIIFDEAHMLLSGMDKDSRKAVEYTLEIGRLGRKTGDALWLGTHLPGLSELGGEQALRDMLRGGNVISFRTANTVASGMLGLEKDPSKIPPYFRNGKETTGVNYVVSLDNRPDAPMRTDLVPKAVKRRNPVVPVLDERYAEAMDRAMRMGGVQLPIPAGAPALTVVPPTDDDAPPGRSAADAILAVLDEAGTELDRGEIVKRSGVLVTTSWGRAKPFSVRAQGDALRTLAEAGRIEKTGHGTYARVRPTLHAVPGNDHASSEATGA